MKIIVIGPSLSGKTTIARRLKAQTILPVEEIDELLVKKNGGIYPTDFKYKKEMLAPQIIKEVLGRNNTVFFTNTDYFAANDLKNARDKGFKIIQLSLSLDNLTERNRKRMKDEGYEDASRWLDGMLRYQQEIRNEGLVDQIINAEQPTEKIVEELLILTNSEP